MLQGNEAPLRISANAQLGDPLFAFTEIDLLPVPLSVLGLPADPRDLERRILRLEAQVRLLDQTVADLHARTLSAIWHRFVLWLRRQWPWR